MGMMAKTSTEALEAVAKTVLSHIKANPDSIDSIDAFETIADIFAEALESIELRKRTDPTIVRCDNLAKMFDIAKVKRGTVFDTGNGATVITDKVSYVSYRHNVNDWGEMRWSR